MVNRLDITSVSSVECDFSSAPSAPLATSRWSDHMTATNQFWKKTSKPIFSRTVRLWQAGDIWDANSGN